jgi:hypothetical protein
MKWVKMATKHSISYLLFDELCAVADNIHKHYIIDNADADVDDNE